MARSNHNTFTKNERAAINDRITALEQMRLLGGESTSFDESGAGSIYVMPIDDGAPRYVITKRSGRFHLADGDGVSVVTSDRLDHILAALP